jgi:hypothetical protein
VFSDFDGRGVRVALYRGTLCTVLSYRSRNMENFETQFNFSVH